MPHFTEGYTMEFSSVKILLEADQFSLPGWRVAQGALPAVQSRPVIVTQWYMVLHGVRLSYTRRSTVINLRHILRHDACRNIAISDKENIMKTEG